MSAVEKLAENVVVSIGYNSLQGIRQRFIAGYHRAERGGKEWVEGSLEMAAALREGKDRDIGNNIAFSAWLKQEKMDYHSKNDRAALISLAADITLARTILTETKSTSYRLIWHENKGRYPSTGKTTTRKRTRPNKGIREAFRRMKLGDEIMDKIKGTTLDSSHEMDELIVLNRGAESGEMTEIVNQLVGDAVAGKDVSAVAEAAKLIVRSKPPELINAWRKRMLFAWNQASYAEKETFIEYLMDGLKGEKQ